MILAVAILLLSALPAYATTYYVEPTGSDTTGNGTEATPWANPQKCVNAGSPLVAGDTCLVGPGTYTDTDGNGITVYASSGATVPVGTAALPITLKSRVPLGAIIKVRQDSTATQAGFYISKNYYVIDGFEVDGDGGGTPSSTNTQTGIAIWSTGSIVKHNKIHHIGRNFCSNSVNGMSGVYVGTGTADNVVEYNEFYSIGRLRGVTGVNENGCTLTPGNQGTAAHDHGIYPSQATRLTIQRNVIWDTQRGYSVHIYRSSATSNPDTKIEHNTFHGEGAITVGPTTQILVNGTMNNAKIRNNIFSAPRAEVAFPFTVTFTGTAVFSGNRTTVGTWWKTATPAGIDMTTPGNASAVMGFMSASSQDFTLASTSGAINGGVSTGAVFSGSSEDQGAFEVFSPTVATINGQSLDLTTDAVFLPLQTTSGSVGWTVNCTGSGCGTPVVSNATVTGTGNTIRLNITGITGTNCAVGQTWTVTFNAATGIVTDSINIGGHLNQAMHNSAAFAVTNNCSAAPPTIPAGAVIRYEMNEGTGTTLTNTGSLGASANGAISGGGTWGTGHEGAGVTLAELSGQYITVPYGTGFDPSGTSLTVAFFVDIPTAAASANRTYYGAQLGTDKRAYTSSFGGNWRIGVQASNDATAGDIAVTSGMHHVCHEFNHATLTSTLYIDGVASTAPGAVKSYTSYAFVSDFELGRLAGSANGPGGTFDKFTIYESAGKCVALYAAEQPSTGAPDSMTLVTHRWEGVWLSPDGSVEVRTANGADFTAQSFGSVALHVQIQCDNVVACESTSFPLYYSVDGGTYDNAVPNVATADGVYMYGTATSPTLNHFTADGPLTGALSHTDGATTITDVLQSQSYTLAQNSSLTVRYLVSFNGSAKGKTFRFRPKRASGIDFDTYTVSPRVDVIDATASGVH